MKWTDADVRSLANYLAELNGGHVVLRPRSITAVIVDALLNMRWFR